MFLARVTAGWVVLPYTEMGRDGEDSKKGLGEGEIRAWWTCSL